MKRLALTLLAAASLAGGLSACAPLVLGGAAMGTMMFTDRRTAGAQVEDESIELRAAARIREALGSRVNVNVTSYNRQVLLTGEVPDAAHRQTVEQLVARVENVRAIVNELAVMGQSTLGQRSSDTLVTAKVRATLVDAADLQANAFRVTTERGTVYLMGRVTQREADRATELTRSVGGVQRVVRVFEILSEEELARLSTRSAAPAPRPAPAADPMPGAPAR